MQRKKRTRQHRSFRTLSIFRQAVTIMRPPKPSPKTHVSTCMTPHPHFVCDPAFAKTRFKTLPSLSFGSVASRRALATHLCETFRHMKQARRRSNFSSFGGSQVVKLGITRAQADLVGLRASESEQQSGTLQPRCRPWRAAVAFDPSSRRMRSVAACEAFPLTPLLLALV
jgi:hypothetical protein